ncbi:MAG TPA: hypothetical protein VIH06_12685 [Ilumatobacteraceae bacterium]
MHGRWVVAAFVVVTLAGCDEARTVTVPDAAEVVRPDFEALPDDLADSRQLEALTPRETAGLEPDVASAAGSLLPDALAALAALDPKPSALSRLSIYNDSVYFSFLDRGITGRTITAVYRSADDFSISEPRFDESATYAIAAIVPDVPQRLIDAIEARFPQTRVTGLDLDAGSSYDFGLVWNIDVEDARGRLATVFADPNGAIVGVDMD